MPLVMILLTLWCLPAALAAPPGAPLDLEVPLGPPASFVNPVWGGASESLLRWFSAPGRLPAPPQGVWPLRPYAEYEPASYFLMSAMTSFGSKAAKLELLRNLPSSVEAVIVVSMASDVPYYESLYGSARSAGETHFIVAPGYSFWARDALPIPVFIQGQNGNAQAGFGVVDAKYYHDFSADSVIAQHFSAPVFKHDAYYEGGNFLPDTHGNCLMVRQPITEEIAEDFYGCSKVVSLDFVAGIGHVDEHVKFLSDSDAFTDLPEYQDPLKSLGYNVTLLPRPSGAIRTYINSLLVNGTVFVPVFGENTDQAAIDAYAHQGLTVVPLDSRSLSDEGKGSIHCVTMTYPAGPFQE